MRSLNERSSVIQLPFFLLAVPNIIQTYKSTQIHRMSFVFPVTAAHIIWDNGPKIRCTSCRVIKLCARAISQYMLQFKNGTTPTRKKVTGLSLSWRVYVRVLSMQTWSVDKNLQAHRLPSRQVGHTSCCF